MRPISIGERQEQMNRKEQLRRVKNADPKVIGRMFAQYGSH